MTTRLAITAVSVHPDGAIVHRRGSAPIVDGQVRVTTLPLLLDESSVRVQVTGGELVQAKMGLELPSGDPVAEVEEQRAYLEHQRALALHQAEVAHLTQVRGFTDGLHPAFDPEGVPLTAARIASWAGLDAALTPWCEQVDERLRHLEQAGRDLTEQGRRLLAALNRRSTEALWQRWAPTRQLTLDVRGDTVDIAVSYAIPGARWTPAYAIDLSADLQRGRFVMRALIGQATGEDWSNVQIALCTAPCLRTIALPKLAAMRLGTVQPPRPTGWRPLPADLDALFPAQDRPDPCPAERPQGRAELGGASADEFRMYDSEEPVPEPMRVEEPIPPQLPRSRSSLGMLGALSGAADAFLEVAEDLAFARGGAPTASAPAPQSKPRPLRKKRSTGPAPRSGVDADQMDYANLRVHGPDAGEGLRGRLHALDGPGRFIDRGLPAAAFERWTGALQQLIEGTHLLESRPMPTHHTVPSAVDGADVRFDAPGEISVPSDGRFHSATLFTETAEVAVSYRAVPRHDTRVFRQVEATTPRTGALPPGPLEASIDGALEIVAPFGGAHGDAAVSFGLGAEDGLTLVRNVRYQEQSAGMLGGSRRFTTAVQVELASALDHAVRVELLERVPVPLKEGTPAFKVTDASPPVERYEGEDDEAILEGGRRQWLTVPAGATASALLTYAVTLSNKEEIAGGDRRA